MKNFFFNLEAAELSGIGGEMKINEKLNDLWHPGPEMKIK
jgi:hypothetical protein